jgi:nitrile hydratase subunit beta
MNGAHDLGGMHGLGPVERDPHEEKFHAEWERRVFGLTLAMGASGAWNIDMSRHAREDQHPVDYLRSSYYEIWLTGLERLLQEAGIVSAEELASGQASDGGVRPPRKLMAENVDAVLAKGGPVDRPPTAPALFQAGDAVRARLFHPYRHTRLPRYARGRPGVIERVHGCYVFPDTNAHGAGENPQWCYAVRFDGDGLWGPDAEAGTAVLVDCWESYLEAAQ